MRPMRVGTGKRGSSSFDEGSLDQYLREISRYPLINQEEEVRLAQRAACAPGGQGQPALCGQVDKPPTQQIHLSLIHI